MSVELFLAASMAQSVESVREGIDKYAVGYRWLPVGEHENNAHAIEVTSSPLNAVTERIMNGVDAQVDLFQRQGRFAPDIDRPSKALSEIAADAWPGHAGRRPKYCPVHVLMSLPPVGVEGTNVTITDNGAGQPHDRFKTTYMSIGGTNKITNPLMAGTYGQGGHAIYQHTEVTVLWERHVNDSNRICFTIIRRDMKPGWRAESYVYLVGPDEEPLTININDIPSSMICDPENISFTALDPNQDGTARDKLRELLSNVVLLPRQGTVVRAFEMQGLKDKFEIYYGLREICFGIKAPVRFIHGPSKVAHSATYYITGLRGALDDPKRLDTESARRINHALFVEKPHTIMNGRATLACWVLDKPLADGNEDFRNGTIAASQAARPIFITLNGQTHKRLPIRVLLRHAKLLHLEQHIIVEINCDEMDNQSRARFFTSSRENVTEQMEHEIKDAVEKYLTSTDRLAEINDEFRNRLMRRNETDLEVRADMERFAEIMGTKLAGQVFSRFGNPYGSRAFVIGENVGPAAYVKPSGPVTPVVLNPIPTRLEIFSKTVAVGEQDEHIRVRSDAMDDWADAFSITKLPPFLTHVGTPGLHNGRISYNVTVSPDALIGMIGEVEIRIDRSRVNMKPLVATSMIMVVKRERLAREHIPRAGLPDYDVKFIGKDDPVWRELLHPMDLNPSAVALRYMHENGKLTVVINTDFGAYQALIETMGTKYGAENAKCAKDDYAITALMFSLSDIEAGGDEDDDPIREDRRQHRSACAAMKPWVMTTLLNYENLSQRGKRRSKLDGAVEAAD